jgi:hypothetical protein
VDFCQLSKFQFIKGENLFHDTIQQLSEVQFFKRREFNKNRLLATIPEVRCKRQYCEIHVSSTCTLKIFNVGVKQSRMGPKKMFFEKYAIIMETVRTFSFDRVLYTVLCT